MRLHRGVRTLAAAASALAIAAPAAQAKFDNTTYPAYTPGQAAYLHHSGGTTDWALIGLGAAAGGAALVGVGVAGSRRRVRRGVPSGSVRAASGS